MHSDDAYLDNFTVTVSPSTGVNKTVCGGEIWRTIVSNVSIYWKVDIQK